MAGIFIGISLDVNKADATIYFQALTTLVAAFGGAWAAFSLHEAKEKEKREIMHRDAGNQALHTIFRMWNMLFDYKQKSVDPHRTSQAAWLNLDASPLNNAEKIAFDGGSLNFLLSSKYASIYSELFLEESHFHHLVALINTRSSLLMKVVWPMMGAGGLQKSQRTTEEEMLRLIGPDNTEILKSVTPEIINQTYQDINSLADMFLKLREALMEIYPSYMFIRSDLHRIDE